MGTRFVADFLLFSLRLVLIEKSIDNLFSLLLLDRFDSTLLCLFFLFLTSHLLFQVGIIEGFGYAVADVTVLPLFLLDALLADIWRRLAHGGDLWRLPYGLVLRFEFEAIGRVCLARVSILPCFT